MIITGNLALASPAEFPQWPAGDTVILRSRVIRPGTPGSRLSRFADPVWIVQPAHPDAHHSVNSLHWSRFPGHLVPVFKTFTLAVLDHPYPPVLAIERRGPRMAIDTISSTVRDLRVFAQWMSDQGMQALPEVTPGALDAYRTHVLALAIPAPRKAKLLNAVRILRGFRDLLPGQCRLPEAAPWDGASGHSLAKVTVGEAAARPRGSRRRRWKPCWPGRCGCWKISGLTSLARGRNTASSTTAPIPPSGALTALLPPGGWLASSPTPGVTAPHCPASVTPAGGGR